MTNATAEPALLDRVPPQDTEAERCVLGCVLADNASLDDIAVHMTVEDLYALAHRQVFDAMTAMREAGTKVDAVTLRDELQRRKQLDDVGGVPYLLTLLETVPHAAHAGFYARIVREKSIRRSMIEAATAQIREAHDPSEDVEQIHARAEQRLFGTNGTRLDIGSLSIRAGMESALARIFERMDKAGQVAGIPSGFANLDKILSGFQPAELLILAARPSMGKTAMVCNIVLAVSTWLWKAWREECDRGDGPREPAGSVLVFSLEQSRAELAERLLCILGKIDGHRLRQGVLNEFEQMALTEAHEQLQQLPVYIDDTPAQTMTRIAAISRRLKRQKGVELVIIDYLQLVESEDRKQPREQQIAGITRRLKFLAKELAIPIVVLAQLNRGVEQREDKRPRLSDLRESGAIEQDADVVMFLHRPDAYRSDDRPGEVDLIVAKNRQGPVGTAELVWMKHALRFGDKAEAPEIRDF